MNQLVAAKSNVVWKEALCVIALMVPLSQLGRLSFSKCRLWLLLSLECRTFGTTCPMAGSPTNSRLPFPLASWALPLSPEVAARQHLLWHVLILAVVPELSHARRYGSKRVVHTSLLLQYGHVVPCVLLFTLAIQTCGCPAGHLSHCHTALMLLRSLTLISPRCMFLSTCHCCCKSGLNKLISGDPCGLLSV